MKIFMKILFICFLLLGYFIGSKLVSAKELTLDFASFYYVRTTDKGSVNSWNHPIYKIDGETTYCIDFEITQGKEYEIADWSYTNIDSSKKEQILLTAYYGYEYPNHHSESYLAATQAILWELSSLDKVNVTFNTKRFGEGENIDFSKERNEIEQLVKHHYDKPALKDKYQVNLNDSLELNDSLLANYDIVSNGDLNISKNGNNIVINANMIGSHKIKLVRKQVYNHPYYILISKGYQNMLMAGNLDPFYIEFEIEVLSGNITVNKKDAITHNNILQSGIKFKLKDLSNNYICSDSCVYETDENGQFTINNLPYGTYYLEEVDDYIEGYLWNNELLPINVDSINNTIDFYNQPVYGNIKISKYGEKINFDKNNVTYEKILLPRVKYILKAREDIVSNKELIYHKDEIVKNIETDENGNIEILNLPLGHYYLYEESSTLNHIIDKEIYNIDLVYKDQYTENIYFDAYLYNYLPKGNIRIIKQDEDTKLTLSGVKFGLYKDDKLLLECITNSNGECLFSNIVYDKYIIKELECLDGYMPNNDLYNVNLASSNVDIHVFNQKEVIEFAEKEIIELSVPDTSSWGINIFIILIIIIFNIFI